VPVNARTKGAAQDVYYKWLCGEHHLNQFFPTNVPNQQYSSYGKSIIGSRQLLSTPTVSHLNLMEENLQYHDDGCSVCSVWTGHCLQVLGDPCISSYVHKRTVEGKTF
jgi:hypothetical protein